MCDTNGHKSYAKHFYTHLAQLKPSYSGTLQIMELIQYTLLYTIASLYVGTYVDKLFYHERIDNLSTLSLVGSICAHMVVTVLAIFYIRKFIQLIPFVGEGFTQHKPHCGILEFDGELGIGIIFIATQRNLFINVQEFVRRTTAF